VVLNKCCGHPVKLGTMREVKRVCMSIGRVSILSGLHKCIYHWDRAQQQVTSNSNKKQVAKDHSLDVWFVYMILDECFGILLLNVARG